MRQVQEALKDIGIPVMEGVWRATSPNQNPPTQYVVYSSTTTEASHQDDSVTSYRTFVYLNLWSDIDPTETANRIREAMYSYGFTMVEESDKGYNQPSYRDDISKKKVCADCVGLIKGYCWTGGGKGVIESIGTDSTYASSYGANDCPDKSANSMFTYAKNKGCAWGTMDSLPEVPGIALHSDGHVGVYVGGGYAVDARGFSYGCVKTRVKDRNWTHWYFLPFIDYGEASNAKQPQTEYALGSRLLTKGTEGNDVKQLQEHLLKLGYSLPKYGADGDFGSETEAAVRAFQKAEGLEVDGKYGEKSHAALMDALSADDEAPEPPAQPEDGGEENDAEKPVGSQVVIVSEGGKVNIRVGNGTQYGRITQLAPGTTLDYVATAQNGWNAVVVNARVGWVSGEYSKLI